MQPGQARVLDEDRSWEHRLFPMLLAAFAIAAVATLATAPRWTRRFAPSAAPPVTTASVQAATARFGPTRPSVAARGDKLVPMQVADVILPEGESTSVVLLVDGDSEYVLPVFLPTAEAEAVKKSLRQAKEDHPPTHQLLGNTVQALGGEVERVEVDDVLGEQFLGQVVLKRGDNEVVLDAKPGDALALALSTGSPVYTARRLLVSQGIKKETVKHRPGGLPSSLKQPERL